VKEEWGWTSYHKTHLSNKNGVPLYEGHFRQDHDLMGWTTIRLRFCTRHPVKALRLIANSGQNPIDFHEKEILA
jgi:hypothetical protein